MFLTYYLLSRDWLPAVLLKKPGAFPVRPPLEIEAPLLPATQVVSPEQRTVTVAGGQYVRRNR